MTKPVPSFSGNDQPDAMMIRDFLGGKVVLSIAHSEETPKRRSNRPYDRRRQWAATNSTGATIEIRLEAVLADVRQLDKTHLERMRACVNCGTTYSIKECLENSEQYFNPPHRFEDGCLTHCLECWLGCGPDHIGIHGHLLRELGGSLSLKKHLVVMPLARILVDSPLVFPNHTNIYPAGEVDLDLLRIRKYVESEPSLAAYISHVSRVDEDVLGRHPLIAFPCEFEWDDFWKTSHKNQMEFLRVLSDIADLNCLNLIRYRQCSIESAHSLPARAGQLNTDPMMAGAALYNAARGEGRIVGGDAFSSFITKGLGLPIEPVEYGEFPGEGEVGHLVNHALLLYSAMLWTDNPTTKFTQALALLDFLAEPYEYAHFKDLKKTIARYVAKNNVEYERLLDRFKELTSKIDPLTHENLGYRTRIMHLGDRLDRLIPDPQRRIDLFTELDGYIRSVMDHMMVHSQSTWAEYIKLREQMKPFEN